MTPHSGRKSRITPANCRDAAKTARLRAEHFAQRDCAGESVKDARLGMCARRALRPAQARRRTRVGKRSCCRNNWCRSAVASSRSSSVAARA
jgi:hypothetical protein